MVTIAMLFLSTKSKLASAHASKVLHCFWKYHIFPLLVFVSCHIPNLLFLSPFAVSLAHIPQLAQTKVELDFDSTICCHWWLLHYKE